MNKRTEAFAKARDDAFFLLKFRLRSVDELFLRLKRKKFPEVTAREVVAFLKDKKFIDDNVFAKAWLNSRLKRSLGLRRIRQELGQKGVEKEVVESEISKVKGYSESEIVLGLAKKRLEKLKAVERAVAKRRVYAYLVRRGFSPEAVIDTLNQLCTQSSRNGRGAF